MDVHSALFADGLTHRESDYLVESATKEESQWSGLWVAGQLWGWCIFWGSGGLRPFCTALIVLPYLAGGVYCRLLGERVKGVRRFPLIVGLVPAVAEKMLGLAIVWRVWAIGAEGVPGQSFWDFLATGVPEIAWFTPVCWAVGLVASPLLVQLVASPPACPSGVRPGSR